MRMLSQLCQVKFNLTDWPFRPVLDQFIKCIMYDSYMGQSYLNKASQDSSRMRLVLKATLLLLRGVRVECKPISSA